MIAMHDPFHVAPEALHYPWSIVPGCDLAMLDKVTPGSGSTSSILSSSTQSDSSSTSGCTDFEGCGGSSGILEIIGLSGGSKGRFVFGSIGQVPSRTHPALKI